jgi:phenylpropionate dioxygenase-like ring-hydroxylating dioxygenase large terminal subunit
MLTKEDNERLTRVGAGTPMGDVFRRYWLPAALSTELPESDGAPVRVRLLGEDLVAYRDTEGKVGLVDAFCPHRRAPLFFGRNEEGGIRCVYHGWKFDRSGTCVDMPSEPPDSLFKTKVKVGAYPTHEAGGIVWAYLGPRETMPAVPDFEVCRVPETHRYVSKTREQCNFLQAMEGGFDGTHALFLHNDNNGDLNFLRDFETLVPKLDIERTEYGYYYAAVRKLGEKQWVRVNQYIMPTLQMRAAEDGPFHPEDDAARVDGHMWIPIDDETTYVYNFLYSAYPETPLSREEAIAVERAYGRGPEHMSPDFSLHLNTQNDFLIDREAQKSSNFTGITGLNTQDFAVQEGMGPIVDRTREHLGTTDRAIIVLRQLLAEATDEVAAGRAPRGSNPSVSRAVRSADRVIPQGRDWQEAIPEAVIARF